VAVLAVSAAVRWPGIESRSIWYDEATTLLETAGNPRPSWPDTPFPAEAGQQLFKGSPALSQITEALRRTDIHPPVYYWLLSLWRRVVGFSLEAARAFSLICSVGTILALYLLLWAGRIEQPFVPVLVYALSTGGVYVAQEARSYALTSLLIVAGGLFAHLAYELMPRNKGHAEAGLLGLSKTTRG
jgi:hypothetical protein